MTATSTTATSTTAISIAIVRPADGTVISGEEHVELVGAVTAQPAGPALHYRWYSSAFPATEGHYSLHEPALRDPGVPYTAALGVGSQAITLAASDQSGQDQDAQNATRNGAIAGGDSGPAPCVVHVLRAVIRLPSPGQVLSRAASVLEAEAPLRWQDAQYRAINRLGYRWSFEPDPADGRPAVDLDPDRLEFQASETGPALRFAGPLPGVGLGGYIVRLRVEDLRNTEIGDEASIRVVIGP